MIKKDLTDSFFSCLPVLECQSVQSLLTEITSNEQLIELYTKGGFLIAVDYPKKQLKLHTIDCMLADPISSVGVKPSKSKASKTGEFWYSKDRNKAVSKAKEIAGKKGYTYLVCPICDR